MRFVKHDGGREGAGFRGETSDCVCRAISIATGRPYRVVYDDLTAAALKYAASRRTHAAKMIRKNGASPRNGVFKEVYRPYLEAMGWEWVPTMSVGSGCTVHLRASELPPGRLIVSVSRHMVAVVDGVAFDNHDPRRGGRRCVYGYFRKDTSETVMVRVGKYQTKAFSPANVQAWRKSEKLSQDDLAKLIGRSRLAISRFENSDGKQRGGEAIGRAVYLLSISSE